MEILSSMKTVVPDQVEHHVELLTGPICPYAQVILEPYKYSKITYFTVCFLPLMFIRHFFREFVKDMTD